MACIKLALLVLLYSLATKADQTIQFSNGNFVGQQNTNPTLAVIKVVGSGTGFAFSAQFTPADPPPAFSLHFNDQWTYSITGVISNQVYTTTYSYDGVEWVGPGTLTVGLGGDVSSSINITGVTVQLLGPYAEVAGDSLQASSGFTQSVISSMGRENLPYSVTLAYLSVPGANSCCFQPVYGFDGVLTFTAAFLDGDMYQGYEYKNVTSATKICAQKPDAVLDFECKISAINYYLDTFAPISGLTVWAESDAVTDSDPGTDSNVGTDSYEDSTGLSVGVKIGLGVAGAIVVLAIVVALLAAIFIVYKKKRTSQYSPVQ